MSKDKITKEEIHKLIDQEKELARKEVMKNKANVIDDFRFKYRFLSNFHLVDVEFEGETYPSTEHAYQAAKSYDSAIRKRIREVDSPGLAKRLGSAPPKGLTNASKDWDSRRLIVMEDLLRQKFAPNTELAKMLLETGDAKLIEGNTWGDTFWGVCNGKGSNHLGILLMKIRNELKEKGNENL